jgi:hypothetical protein
MVKKMLAVVVVVICSFAVMLSAAEKSSGKKVESPEYKKWCAYRDKLMKDDSLVRYYTFEEGAGVYVKNKVGGKEGKGDLSYVDLNAKTGEAPIEDIEWIEGRFPGKKAVALDQCSLSGEGVDSNMFSIEVWFRNSGDGTIAVENRKTGTLISIGGYYDGWRIIYSSKAYRFQIGKPGGATSLPTQGNVESSDWRHFVFTWDGKIMSTYINGVVSVSQKYDGEYVPATTKSNLILGFALNGVGSSKFDYDEVAIYNRVLTPEEIKEHSEVK